jgi:hypothetical protein
MLGCLVLLFALPAETRAAAPEVAAPQPSAAAQRLIGDRPIAFPAQSSPVAPVRLKQRIGTADFTLGLSLETDPLGTHDLGDLISLWNAKTRHGFTLGLRNNTGVTTSQANWRQLQFGIDAGTAPSWRDEGRPGTSILGFSLCVHQGALYVGTCEPNTPQAGQVYRYAGPNQWEPLGVLDGSNSVVALASFNGQLYAGTGKYRLQGSSLPESNNDVRGGKIYRLIKSGEWELVGDLAPTEAIAGLVTFGGRLYASSLYKPAGFYRYDGGKKWTSIPTPDGKRVQSLAVHHGALYAGSYDSGSVYRYDGVAWQDLGPPAKDITQTYSFAVYEDALHVSTWPRANAYRLDAGNRWVDRGRLGDELEVMGMLVHNGVFYAGSLPKAEMYRYEGGEGGTSWRLLKQLDDTPDVRYRRLWAMATYQGRLFSTTLPSGRIWSMAAGHLVTHDHELPPGWHDVVAQRAAGKLRLFVDGKLVAETAEAEGAQLDLATEGLELQIGNGPRGRFVGQMKNVWFDLKP